MMFTRRRFSVSGKHRVENLQIDNLRDVNPSPGWKMSAVALAAGLVRQQERASVLDAVVVWLSDPFFAVIGKANLSVL